MEHFLPVQLLGCARLAHLELVGCGSVHLPPVLGELPALSSIAVRDAKVGASETLGFMVMLKP